MFYLKEDIDLLTTCNVCKEKFDLPKVLPCGNTICSKCEKKICHASPYTIIYICPLCDDYHYKTMRDGLPINLKLIDLMRISTRNVSNCIAHENTNQILDNIKLLCEQLTPEYIEMKFREHYSLLPNHLHRSPNNNNINDLLNQVSDYDDKYLKQKNTIISKLNDIQGDINSSKESYFKFKDKLKNADVNEIESINIEARNIQHKLESLSKLLPFRKIYLEEKHENIILPAAETTTLTPVPVQVVIEIPIERIKKPVDKVEEHKEKMVQPIVVQETSEHQEKIISYETTRNTERTTEKKEIPSPAIELTTAKINKPALAVPNVKPPPPPVIAPKVKVKPRVLATEIDPIGILSYTVPSTILAINKITLEETRGRTR